MISAAPRAWVYRTESRSLRLLQTLARLGGPVILVVGAVGLTGWIFRVEGLENLVPGFATIKANSAIGLMVLGLSAVFAGRAEARRAPRWPAPVLAVLAGALGAFSLYEYLTGWSPGFDEWLFQDPRSRLMGLPPGRMSPITAVLFVVAGASFALRDPWPGSRRGRVAELLALLTSFVALQAALGYLLDVRALYAVGAFSTIALPCVFAFGLAGLSVLFTRPESGLLRVVVSDSVGGTMCRVLVPIVLTGPVLIAWLRLLGQRLGWYGTEFGVALSATASIVGYAMVIPWLGNALMRADGERLAHEEALAASEKNLETTLQSIGDGVIATDPEARVVRMNPVAEDLTGFTLVEARGRPLPDVFRIVNEETRQPVENPGLRALREGRVVGLANHTVLMSRDGSERAIADSGAPIRDGEGQVSGAVLVFRDQSTERAAELALRRSEARKTAILEAAFDGIVTIDHAGLVTEANAATERIFGWSRHEVVGQPLASVLFRARPQAAGRAAFQRWLLQRQGDEARRIEFNAQRADGSEVPLEITMSGMRAHGTPEYTAYIRELSEVKRTAATLTRLEAEAQAEAESRVRAEQALEVSQAQLRQAQKMEAIGLLAGGIAHDFNNLLTVILGYGRLMLDRLRPADPMHHEVEQMTEAGERASLLTRQLLAFGRRQVLNPVVLELGAALRSMDDMLGRLLGEDIELEWVLRARGHVRVDRSQLEQVLVNLAVNARDAMPEGGRLVIETADVEADADFAVRHLGLAEGRYVSLSVSDTGTGMDKATQERIFEPFFTTKPQGRGTGLGLSTVFGIVQQSGGGIYVYSEPGSGTTFRVYLPETHEPALPSQRLMPRPSEVGHETVLLVEDDEQVRALTLTVLKSRGYQVLAAPNGETAIHLCEEHAGPIHLLITDMVMPRMSGLQVAEAITRLRPGVRVLVMSGYSDEIVREKRPSGPEVEFIQKPLIPNELLAKVRSVLGPPQH